MTIVAAVILPDITAREEASTIIGVGCVATAEPPSEGASILTAGTTEDKMT